MNTPTRRPGGRAVRVRVRALLPVLVPVLVPVLAGAAAAARAEPATYAIDPTHTFVYFEVRHQGLSTARGRFDRKSGTVTLDRAAGTGRAQISFEAASVNTGVVPFDGALRGANYLNAAQFPTVTFDGDRFVFDGDRLAEVGGQLTLLGRSLPVTLRAAFWSCVVNTRLNREVCGGDFTTRIRRSEWGMTQGIPTVPDEVGLVIQVEGIRQP